MVSAWVMTINQLLKVPGVYAMSHYGIIAYFYKRMMIYFDDNREEWIVMPIGKKWLDKVINTVDESEAIAAFVKAAGIEVSEVE